jgi:hypothetical protein
MTVDYKSRPQNQFGQIKKHRTTKQPRFNELGEILCTYCIVYKPKTDFLLVNLKRRYYRCMKCEHEYRKSRLGNVNRLIDSIYGHQKEKTGQLSYTIDELSEWLATTSFFELHRNWVLYHFSKKFTPTVLRINPKKPYTLNNLKVSIASHARTTSSQMRERKVIQLDDDENEIAIFSNARVAAQFLKYKCYSNIHEVCKGRKLRAAGFKWKYA